MGAQESHILAWPCGVQGQVAVTVMGALLPLFLLSDGAPLADIGNLDNEPSFLDLETGGRSSESHAPEQQQGAGVFVHHDPKLKKKAMTQLPHVLQKDGVTRTLDPEQQMALLKV